MNTGEHITYYFLLADGTPVLKGQVEPEIIEDFHGEIHTMHHPRAVARYLNEHPELDIQEIVATRDHLDGAGVYGCCCAGCAQEAAEQQAADIDAEMAIERHYENAGFWEAEAERDRMGF